MEDKQHNTDEIYVDIDKVLQTRSPKIYKWLPRFVVNYIIKLVCQDEINEFNRVNKDKMDLSYLNAVIEYLNIDLTFEGLENIDKTKKYVFASNHPLGGLDGLGLLKVIHDNIGDAKAIINDLLMYLVNLRPLFQGVNVYKKNSREHLKNIDDLYTSEKQIVVFPSGMVSRKIKGKITDLEWKKSFLSKAVQHHRDVVPVFISGQNSKYFYNFANMRKFIGLKFNIELIYLPREFFTYRDKGLHIKFGKPMPYSMFDDSKRMDLWVEDVRKEVYNLSN